MFLLPLGLYPKVCEILPSTSSVPVSLICLNFSPLYLLPSYIVYSLSSPTGWAPTGQGFCLPDSLLNLQHLKQWLAHGMHSISIISSFLIKHHSDLLFTVYPLLSCEFWYTCIPYSNFKLKKRERSNNFSFNYYFIFFLRVENISRCN